MFQAAGTGDHEAESNEDDSFYWNQYDQFTATATTPGLDSESFDLTKEITTRLDDRSSYYDQYDNVETVITSAGSEDSVKPGGTASSGMSGPTENGFLGDIGIEEYVRNTIRNLSQLAIRCGMSEKRLRQLIREEMS